MGKKKKVFGVCSEVLVWPVFYLNQNQKAIEMSTIDCIKQMRVPPHHHHHHPPPGCSTGHKPESWVF